MDVTLIWIITILPLLCSIWMIFSYYKFRYPKNYSEMNLISYDKVPILVNGMGGSLFVKRVGVPNINGVIATIIDLIGRKHLKPHYMGLDEDSERIVLLEINRHSKDKLEHFELDILNFLKIFSKKNCISLQKAKKEITIDENVKFFKKKCLCWRIHYKEYYLKKEYNNTLFKLKNNRNNLLFGYSSLLMGLIIFCVFIYDPFSSFVYPIFSSLIVILSSTIYLIFLRNTCIEWRGDGENYFIALSHFRNAINNFNLENENFPNINEVSRYLSYGAALGVADNSFELLKSMEIANIEEDVVYNFFEKGGYDLLRSIFLNNRYDAEYMDLRFMSRMLLDAGHR